MGLAFASPIDLSGWQDLVFLSFRRARYFATLREDFEFSRNELSAFERPQDLHSGFCASLSEGVLEVERLCHISVLEGRWTAEPIPNQPETSKIQTPSEAVPLNGQSGVFILLDQWQTPERSISLMFAASVISRFKYSAICLHNRVISTSHLLPLLQGHDGEFAEFDAIGYDEKCFVAVSRVDYHAPVMYLYLNGPNEEDFLDEIGLVLCEPKEAGQVIEELYRIR